MNTRKRFLSAAFLVLSLSFGLSLADSARTETAPPEARNWRTAPRHSSGLAPDPIVLKERAIVQVYSAATYGWRGLLAEHPWIIFKRAGESAYTRYDVIGWRGTDVVRRNYALPDGLWFGATPSLLVDHQGEEAEEMIGQIEGAIRTYPYADNYRSYPGPNSNTFLAHIGREVPALKLDLPANAIGKDYRPIDHPVGVSPTGSGVQVSLLGLLGFSLGLQEGLEVNILGLNFGIDLNRPAFRLPFIGRLGMSDTTVSGNP